MNTTPPPTLPPAAPTAQTDDLAHPEPDTRGPTPDPPYPPAPLDPLTLTWPPDFLYWSILDTPGTTRAGTLSPGLLALLADELPIDPADIHAVGVPIGDGGGGGSGRVLVCAAERAALATIDPHTCTLTPESIPAQLGLDADVSANLAPRLNLLVGDFEPAPFRRRRARTHLHAAAACLLLSLLAALGFLRRAQAVQREEISTRAASLTALRELRPDLTDAPASTLRAALAADTARLRSAKSLCSRIKAPADAAAALAEILLAWPAPSDTPARPLSISAGGETVTAAVVIEGVPTGKCTLRFGPSGEQAPDR